MADCFLDTNILLYAVSTNPAEAEKTRIARESMQTADWAWSAQVAVEFIRASTAAHQPKPLARAEARRWIELWTAFPMAAVDGALVLEATLEAGRFQLSHFNAQILAAAKQMGCERCIPKISTKAGIRRRASGESFHALGRMRRLCGFDPVAGRLNRHGHRNGGRGVAMIHRELAAC